MIFYSKGIKGSNNFTTNGKIRSFILGLKGIDKVDNLAIDLSMMSMILRDSDVNNDISENYRLSKTSRTLILFGNERKEGFHRLLSSFINCIWVLPKRRGRECLIKQL